MKKYVVVDTNVLVSALITKKEFPILEFDTEKVAKINPENLFPEKF